MQVRLIFPKQHPFLFIILLILIIFIISFLIVNSIAIAQNQKTEIAKGVTTYHDLFNISMNSGVSCYRIPSIVTAQNGDLVVAIDERIPSCVDLKWSRDINIVIRRSSDNGKTWSAIEKIVDFQTGKSEDITSQITKPEWYSDFKFITSGRGIQTKSGTLLHCMVNITLGR